jgi:hypothetical protein
MLSGLLSQEETAGQPAPQGAYLRGTVDGGALKMAFLEIFQALRPLVSLTPLWMLALTLRTCWIYIVRPSGSWANPGSPGDNSGVNQKMTSPDLEFTAGCWREAEAVSWY